jgi:hypothetical protein
MDKAKCDEQRKRLKLKKEEIAKSRTDLDKLLQDVENCLSDINCDGCDEKITETDLSKDCLKVKEIYNKSRSWNTAKDFFFKKTRAKIVFGIYVLSFSIYIPLLYHFREDDCISKILSVPVFLIAFILLQILNKMTDRYIKEDIMHIDNEKKYNIFNLYNFLFREKLIKNMDINVAKAEIIIKQLELENGNSNISYLSIYSSFFTTFIVPAILGVIGIDYYILIALIVIGVLFILIYYTIINIINKEKDINDDIIVNLKKYILDEKYNQIKT